MIKTLGVFFVALVVPLAGVATAQGQKVAPARPAMRAADPWPREVKVRTATLLIYQPQVESWTGNVLTFRSAVAVRPVNGKDEIFGVIWATARTQVDRVSRIVALEDFKVTRSNFPTLPDQGASYVAALQAKMAPSERTIALDRLEASLAASGAMKPVTFPVSNDPPRIIVSQTPAILVNIDGPPVLRPVPGSRFDRVINTRALILRESGESAYYLHVYNGWLYAGSLDSSWFRPSVFPPGLDQVATSLAKSRTVDLLDGGNVKPPLSLAAGVPTIYVSETPAELIVFKGEPAFTTIEGTTLNWATNTHADVIFDTAGTVFYVLLSGRWYSGPSINGPWSYAPSASLPADFRRIPASSPAGVVLSSVAGTPQAREAVIENSIPQTASVPRVNGPRFKPIFDGPPQLRPVDGTSLQYVINSPTPIIEVSPTEFYALRAGVWYSATALTGPWTVAAYVPPVMYTIPPTSPLHYVTYVQVYGATPTVVYVGYTPGYMGTVVNPDGVVVYGTGYTYQPWVGNAWYPPPATYGVAAQPIYNPATGMAFGFAMGATTAALVNSSSSSSYHPSYYGYPCCASTSYNTYASYGRTVTQGTRSYYANSTGVGQTASGDYTNDRTGTTGSSTAGSSYDPATGSSQKSYTRGIQTTSKNAQPSDRGSQVTYTNPNTGKTQTYGATREGNDVYADKDGNTYKYSGGGWQQHTSNGWQSASSDMSWADREQQGRSEGEERFSTFSQSGAGLGGGGGGWNDQFNGGFSGGGWNDRFNESGDQFGGYRR